MPNARDNRDERIARLEMLIEEYRSKTEATRAEVNRVQQQAAEAVKTAKAALRKVQETKKKRTL